SGTAHTTGVVPTHAPFWHESTVVQALPSLQVVPFAFAGFEQTPVAVLQVPALWHWSGVVHTTGLAPAHSPSWQESVCVHALPSLHAVPFVLGGFEHNPVVALHTPAVRHWPTAKHVTLAQRHASPTPLPTLSF